MIRFYTHSLNLFGRIKALLFPWIPILITLQFLSFAMFSQNWQPMYFNETAYFEFEGQPESAYLRLYPYASNEETITMRFLPQLNSEAPCNAGSSNCSLSGMCKVASIPFLREFAVFMENGVVEFRNPDTLTIQCLRELGESWVFKTSSSGESITAEIVGKYEGIVLGQTDSIKQINASDGTTFLLSKHYGIISWSENGSNYILESIPTRNLGDSILTFKEIFSFGPGDVFVHLYRGNVVDNSSGLSYFSHSSRGIARFDVVNVIEEPEERKIVFQITLNMGYLNNWSGMYSGYSTITSYIDTLRVNLVSECNLFNWPVGGPLGAFIPNEIYDLYYDLNGTKFYCNERYTEYHLACSDSALVGSNINSNHFSTLDRGIFGDRNYFSTSMQINEALSIAPSSTFSEVYMLEPSDFYLINGLIRCQFDYYDEFQHIQSGEHFKSSINSFGHLNNQIAVADGLGIIAFEIKVPGLGSYCFSSSVMIGYQKAGETPFGYIPGLSILLNNDNANINARASLNIYPNPVGATRRVHLAFPDANERLQKAELWDMQGRLVKTDPVSSHNPQIDLQGISGGIYLIRAWSEKGMYTQKLIVEP